MLTREDDVEVHALHKQGWSISAIARHMGKDRKTIRAYLAGERVAGVRARGEPDPFDRFAAYCAERLKEDPHLWASALFDEVLALGYERSYPTFTRQLRARSLRPACEPCRPATRRPVAIIEHPSGAETQRDWLELPDPPTHWDGYSGRAFLLVGALSHSGRWRGVLAERADQPHSEAVARRIRGRRRSATCRSGWDDLDAAEDRLTRIPTRPAAPGVTSNVTRNRVERGDWRGREHRKA